MTYQGNGFLKFGDVSQLQHHRGCLSVNTKLRRPNSASGGRLTRRSRGRAFGYPDSSEVGLSCERREGEACFSSPIQRVQLHILGKKVAGWLTTCRSATCQAGYCRASILCYLVNTTTKTSHIPIFPSLTTTSCHPFPTFAFIYSLSACST